MTTIANAHIAFKMFIWVFELEESASFSHSHLSLSLSSALSRSLILLFPLFLILTFSLFLNFHPLFCHYLSLNLALSLFLFIRFSFRRNFLISIVLCVVINRESDRDGRGLGVQREKNWIEKVTADPRDKGSVKKGHRNNVIIIFMEKKWLCFLSFGRT